MAQIFLALNFGESSALESAENSDFFHVMQNLYAQSAQNLTSDQPPPSYMEPLLTGRPPRMGRLFPPIRPPPAKPPRPPKS